MSSPKELLHQIANPNLSIDQRAQLRCRLARQLEQAWNFEAAREAMGELWQRVGERPVLEGLDEQTRAQVLLRSGALTGWIGSTRQIEGAQETAKDYLTESITIFESFGLLEKLSEAQIELAYCYWREGAFDEARVMLQEALSRQCDLDNEIRSLGVLRSAIVDQSAKRLHDALYVLNDATALFERITNDVLKGKFHHEFGNVLKDLGAAEQRQDYLDRALIEFAAASFYFEQAGLSRHQACVENNLGLLLGTIGRFSEAHEHLDRAQVLFTRLKDDVHLAQSDDTRARVMLAEGRIVEAEKTARRALRTLEQGDEHSLLAETLITHGVALACLDHHEQARAALERAVDVAQRAGDPENAGLAAITLVEQLSWRLSNKELCATIERAGMLLEKARDLGVVWRLEKAGRQALFYTNAYPARPDWSTFILKEVQQRNEGRYLELALEDSDGSVTKAADLLGLPSHSSLQKKLNRRHKDLLKVRRPITPRRRSIIPKRDTSRVPSQEAERKTRKVRILHVEDNQVVADAVKETLEFEGWEVETCADGAAALKKILSHAHYDLLLLDYDLPGVSGIELVHRARGVAHRQNTPVIVLSAALGEAAAREAGANKFLHKPEDIRSLVETISGLLSSGED